MSYYKLLPKRGNHNQGETDKAGNPIIYKPGDVIETDMDLVKMFPNKFVEVNVGGDNILPTVDKSEIQRAAERGAKDLKPAEPDEVEEDEEEIEEEEVEEEEETKSNPVPDGAKLSKSFPEAEEQDLKIFYKRGEGYWVTEADDPKHNAINNKPIKKKVEVMAFVNEYLGEE